MEKIDSNEIILEIDQHRIAGCTLVDIQLLIETLSTNGKQMRLKTVKTGMSIRLSNVHIDEFT